MANKAKQIEIAERLQLKLLEHFEKQLNDGTIQATDAATLARLLMANGWSIDPVKVPARLRDILTQGIDATKIDEDNLGSH